MSLSFSKYVLNQSEFSIYNENQSELSIIFSIIMSREQEDDMYDITKPIEFKSKDVDDGFQHFWLPMIFMAMPGINIIIFQKYLNII